jgi:hypothetical protein
MSRKWFLVKALVSLILIGLLIGGGFAIHYLSWSQGYAAGQLAAEGEEVATPPYLPGGFGHPGWHYHPFGVLGLLFKIVLFFLFIAIVAKLIRFVIWGSVSRHAMARPWYRYWRRAHRRYVRWHRMHGPMPPWCWDWDEPDDEDAKEASDESENKD